MQDNATEFPELAEAIERERDRREIAFSDTLLPVAGVWLKQFTPFHLVSLGLVRSPFIGAGGAETPTIAVLEFMWICSPGYRQGSFWRELWFYVRHFRSVHPSAVSAIREYLDAAFMDSPPSASGGKSYRDKSYYAGVTALCDLFASEYGWSDRETMHKPFARLFQYANYIRRKNDKGAVMFNPSDRVIGQMLHKRNAHPNG